MEPDAIGTAECWERLRGAAYGRLAFLTHGRPRIVPVNHLVDRGSLVFRTAAGSGPDPGDARSEVAFEVDGVDGATGEAWSVVVQGTTRRVKNLYELVDAVQLPIEPYHRGVKAVVVRLDAVSVTGRRFPIARRVGAR